MLVVLRVFQLFVSTCIGDALPVSTCEIQLCWLTVINGASVAQQCEDHSNALKMLNIAGQMKGS